MVAGAQASNTPSRWTTPVRMTTWFSKKAGATVLIDSVSQMYMGGSEIDFADDLIGQAFKINNPNATANCGCGTSFSV